MLHLRIIAALIDDAPERPTIKSLRAEYGTIEFAAGPIPSTEAIVQITDAEALLAEGAEMRHCVGGLARRACDGTHAFYRVLEPQRATLALRSEGGSWVVDDFKLAGNRLPSAACRKAVSAWLAAGQA